MLILLLLLQVYLSVVVVVVVVDDMRFLSLSIYLIGFKDECCRRRRCRRIFSAQHENTNVQIHATKFKVCFELNFCLKIHLYYYLLLFFS